MVCCYIVKFRTSERLNQFFTQIGFQRRRQRWLWRRGREWPSRHGGGKTVSVQRRGAAGTVVGPADDGRGEEGVYRGERLARDRKIIERGGEWLLRCDFSRNTVVDFSSITSGGFRYTPELQLKVCKVLSNQVEVKNFMVLPYKLLRISESILNP